MGYLSKGYYVICLSPIISYLLWMIVGRVFLGNLHLIAVLFGQNIPIISIQVSAIALCFFGYKKNEPIHFRQSLNVFVIACGSVAALWGLAAYEWFFDWANMVGADVSFWKYPEIIVSATWVLMGLIWFTSGIFFIYMVWRNSKVAG